MNAQPIKETVQSERLYSAIALRYDTVFEGAILAEDRLTELVQETMTGRRVLDLACGNGRWLARFRPADYVGLDLNEAMLREARQRYPDARVRVRRHDATSLSRRLVRRPALRFGAMGHLPPAGQQAMVDEAWRVLEPRGMAIFTNGNKWSPFSLPTTLTGGRVRIEGVRMRVHCTTPPRFDACWAASACCGWKATTTPTCRSCR